MSRRRSAWRDYRGVGRYVAGALLGLALAMLGCAVAGWLLDAFVPWPERKPRGGVLPLVGGALFASAMGLGTWLLSRRADDEGVLGRREAVVAVTGIWGAASLAGASPFVLAGALGPVGAFFEAVSGLTTTGATVLTDIEGTLPRALLLWRSLLQWLGGMGIVVLFVAVFPNVGAGGKHMFRGEVPGTSAEGLTPRIAETSIRLWKIYVSLTLLQTALLVACGMEAFEALCHAFTTLSTGGFSTRDASFAAFPPSAQWVAAVFMVLAGANFALYHAVLRTRSLRPLWRSVEMRVYLGIVLLATVAFAWTSMERLGDPMLTLRHAFFQTATFISSTGYVTDDYMRYAPAAMAVLVGVMLVGGCSGSTAGGIKVERAVLLAKQSWLEIHESFRPQVVRVVRMGRQVVDRAVLADVAAFFVVFMATLGCGVLMVVLLEDLPLATAFGATLSCISNMGPAPWYQGADNFASYGTPAKLLFALVMLLGRLEFFTLLSLLVPGFWKR